MDRRLYDLARTDGVVVGGVDRGLLRLGGPQAVWFLQNVVTADVESVEPGRWVESAFLTPKGKLVAHFRVGVVAPDDVLVDVDPPATEQLAEWFVRYRFRTKVEVADATSTCVIVIGPRATDLAARGEVRSHPNASVFGDALGDVPIAVVHGTLDAVGQIEGAPREVLDIIRIEAGVGEFGVDFGPDNLPQEAGLTSIVPIDKGCYVGQETIARIHFRGHVNRVVRPLVFQEIAGDPVGRELTFEAQKVGAVTSSVFSPAAGRIGLGMIRVEPPSGSRFEIEGGGHAVVGGVPEGTKVQTS